MKIMQQLHEKKKLKIGDLAEIKRELKQKITLQQNVVLTSVKQLMPFNKEESSSVINLSKKGLSPLKLMALFPLRKGKGMSVIEGILIGYKLMSGARRFIRRR